MIYGIEPQRHGTVFDLELKNSDLEGRDNAKPDDSDRDSDDDDEVQWDDDIEAAPDFDDDEFDGDGPITDHTTNFRF